MTALVFDLCAYAMSYASLASIAQAHGATPHARWMFPLLVLGVGVVGTMGVIAAKRSAVNTTETKPAWSSVRARWGIVLLSSCVSGYFNVDYSDHTAAGVCIALTPPVVQLFATELLVRLIPEDKPEDRAAEELRELVAASEAAAERAREAARIAVEGSRQWIASREGVVAEAAALVAEDLIAGAATREESQELAERAEKAAEATTTVVDRAVSVLSSAAETVGQAAAAAARDREAAEAAASAAATAAATVVRPATPSVGSSRRPYRRRVATPAAQPQPQPQDVCDRCAPGSAHQVLFDAWSSREYKLTQGPASVLLAEAGLPSSLQQAGKILREVLKHHPELPTVRLLGSEAS